MVAEVATVLRQAWRLKAQLAADLWPLAAVVAAFAAFVLANGGIVVGDKAHHVPVRHLAQPLYCPLYCTAWLAPVFWSPAALVAAMRQLAANSLRRPVAVISAVITAGASMVAAVWAGTLAHPFLLADNRHYAFYVWRRLINRSWWTRYAVIPAYLYSGWALQQRLAHRSPLWLLLLAGASCAVLVPAHLLEPRYFTIPFYLTFLHMRSPSTAALAAIVAGFAAVNAATIFLFLAAPFAWPDGSVARFMW
jgi:alpha-1,2-glucosyltransferase